MNCTTTYASPIGNIDIESTEHGITKLSFVSVNHPPDQTHPEGLLDCIQQLDEYFEGSRTAFDLPIDLSALPPFHKEVLKVVMTIPYGRTRSYKQIASFLGNPKAARAVGQANGNNPIAIIIPCHRVIGKQGQLTGYAYGLSTKMKLLQVENPQHYYPQIKMFEEAGVANSV
ncbi:MAG: methylated-DNA--[protein]-cysteine S-methyltransferase [Saprospiraceae bacterium]|nr:methylated-DNA--[protein]-cysteine S-methyltransferase [Saprospiraceae bacterium]